jgi:hypothetical protein
VHHGGRASPARSEPALSLSKGDRAPRSRSRTGRDFT